MTIKTNAALIATLLRSTLTNTETLKGAKREQAIFDYLSGAIWMMNMTGTTNEDVPPWFFIIAVRGGDRVNEVARQIARFEARAIEEIAEPEFDGMATTKPEPADKK